MSLGSEAIFLTSCVLPGQSAFRLGTCSFLASKMGVEGGKPWYLAIVYSFIACFVKIALCCFQL